MTLECLTRFWKLLGWSPLTEICPNFVCPILLFCFWTELVFFCLATVDWKFGLGPASMTSRIGTNLFFFFRTEIVFCGTGSVFSKKELFLSLDFGLVTGLKFGILILDQKELGVSAGTGIGFSNFLCAELVCAADKDNFSVSCSDWWFVTGIVFVSSLVTHKDLSWRVAE